ncbi:MAG: hypothetical protein WCO77_09125 [bacterium]
MKLGCGRMAELSGFPETQRRKFEQKPAKTAKEEKCFSAGGWEQNFPFAIFVAFCSNFLHS